MFFDPTGRHLIITTETGDNYYLFAKWKKAKLLAKIRVCKDALWQFPFKARLRDWLLTTDKCLADFQRVRASSSSPSHGTALLTVHRIHQPENS